MQVMICTNLNRGFSSQILISSLPLQWFSRRITSAFFMPHGQTVSLFRSVRFSFLVFSLAHLFSRKCNVNNEVKTSDFYSPCLGFPHHNYQIYVNTPFELHFHALCARYTCLHSLRDTTLYTNKAVTTCTRGFKLLQSLETVLAQHILEPLFLVLDTILATIPMTLPHLHG